MSRYGTNLKLTLFGHSHGPAIGMTLEGLAAGQALDMAQLQAFLDRRAPGRSPWASPRRETDRPEFLSGLKDGVTCGGPLTAIIRNEDARRQDYGCAACAPRPGHADWPAQVKYGHHWDGAGGGMFSGRLTAALCLAGGVCLQLLERRGITVISRIAAIAGIRDAGELTAAIHGPFPVVDGDRGAAMQAAIEAARREGDSVGGVVECAVLGLPVGLGGPLFEGLDGRIAAAVFGIPAVRGIEFGDGFAAAEVRGSQHNDPYGVEDGRTVPLSNRSGGVLGGMSTGLPLTFRTAIKPTPSIARPQKSVNWHTGQAETVRTAGRHDACIVPRAVPCVEAAAAIAVYDALMEMR